MSSLVSEIRYALRSLYKGRSHAVAFVLTLGLGIGVNTAIFSVINGVLFEIEPTDPLTFVAVGVVLAAVALFAASVPARRATRVDPIDALRAE